MVIEVDSLIKNIKRPTIAYTLDIVLEPGAFNGAYEVGGLIFIRELEKRGFLTVGRISASSIGSFVGFLYLTNNLDRFAEIFEHLRKSFQEDVALYGLRTTLLELAKNIDDTSFKSLQSNKFYISVHDVQKMQQTIQSEFRTREELVDCILKSCHLPLVVNGDVFFESNGKRFLDGGMPYIFKTRVAEPTYKIIYLSISKWTQIKKMLNIGGERSIQGRILEGILDVYTFFHEERETIMSSFVHNWTWCHFLRLRVWHFTYLSLSLMVTYMHKLFGHIHPYVKDLRLYRHFVPFFKNIYNDAVLYLVFS